MRRRLLLILAFVVCCGSIWPAGAARAQESTGDASEGQYASPPPAEEVPQEDEEEAPPVAEAPAPLEQQHAPPPAAPSAQEAPAPAPVPASEPPSEPATKLAAAPVEAPAPSTEQYAGGPAPAALPQEPAPAPTAEPTPPAAEKSLPAEQPAPPPAPEAEPTRSEDQGTIRPATHCGGGLFGPGPPEGTPCDAPPLPPPPPPEDPDQYDVPGDPGQYQYDPVPVTDPVPSEPEPFPDTPDEPGPAPDEPEPGPVDTPPAESEPAPGEVPSEPEPSPEPVPDGGGYYFYNCYNDNCGVQNVPEGYQCEAVYAEGVSPVSGEPERYECVRQDPVAPGSSESGFEYVEGPDGQQCQKVLRFEDKNAEGTPGYRCSNADSTCEYDSNFANERCYGSGEENDDPLACGEDDCGLDVPPNYVCSENFGDYQYSCYDPDNQVTSPSGSTCEQYLYFKNADSPGEARYFCEEPEYEMNGKQYCGEYDANWKSIPCQPGGPGGIGAAWENSDEATEAVSYGRPGGRPDARPPGGGSGGGPNGNGADSSGSGGEGSDATSDPDAASFPDGGASDGPGGEASDATAGSPVGTSGAPVASSPSGSGVDPRIGPAERSPGKLPSGFAANVSPSAAKEPGASPLEATISVLLGGTVEFQEPAGDDPAIEAQGPAGDSDAGEARSASGTEGVDSPEDPSRADGADGTTSASLLTIAPVAPLQGNAPGGGGVEDYAFVEQEGLRRVAFSSSSGDVGEASPDRNAVGAKPAPSGEGPSAASPDRASSMTAMVAVALLAAAGTVVVASNARMRGWRR